MAYHTKTLLIHARKHTGRDLCGLSNLATPLTSESGHLESVKDTKLPMYQLTVALQMLFLYNDD